MHCQTLVKETKYKGMYVALKSFCDNQVVASGMQPGEVLAQAELQGHKMPVIVFVPEKEMTHVY